MKKLFLPILICKRYKYGETMQYVEKQVLCEAIGVQPVNYIVPDGRHTDARTDQVIYRGRFGPKNPFVAPPMTMCLPVI